MGLTPDASAEDIHHAYRRLAKLWHPDRYANAPGGLRARADRRMSALNRAYAVLGDPLARYVYDRDRRLAAEPFVGFSAARSYGRSGTARQRGQPLYHSAPLDATPPPPSSLGNPNGAGEFFALLGVILLLMLFGWTQRYGFASVFVGIGSLVSMGGLAVLIVLLFNRRSALAQFARLWAEGQPSERHARRRGAPAAGGTTARDRTHPQPGQPRTTTEPDAAETEERARFERLVDEALATIPPEFAASLVNIIVRVLDEPTADDLKRTGTPDGYTLLGLYQGVPLTRQYGQGSSPEVITIYRKPIERVSGHSPARIRARVRATVLHELAHHYGIDHDEMPNWVK